MPEPIRPHRWAWTGIVALLLALPVLAVHAWMAHAFPSYLHARFAQDVVFTLAACGLLACAAHWRLLGVASVPLAVIGYACWLFLVLGEGVSYYLQADSFNARFFAHLDPGNLAAGLHAFPAVIGGSLVLLAVMLVLCSLLLARRPRAVPRPAAGVQASVLVILLLSVAGLDSSPRRLLSYLARAGQATQFADTPQGRGVARLLDLRPTPKADLVAAPGKNVVWIYLESLEGIYWDPRVFPGLAPNLDRLRAQGLDFSGFETFAGANYTMAGIFSSQCGVPLFTSAFAGLDTLAGNNNDKSTFHPGLACFGDVLQRAGYRQVYLGGAPIQFSNKGQFFRLHGYDHALGLQQLEAGAHGKLAESGWGLYDDELFRLALARYRKLQASHQPFNLTLLTLDTHPPDGRPSPGCPRYAANPNSMLQAVHCTDALVGRFVRALAREPGWKDTVVVVMSDHLMMRNDAQPLYPKGYHRQPALVVLNAGQGVRSARMYHMDIAPTLLELMGVRTNASFIGGRDRGRPGAAGSRLADDATTRAVLRKVLWSRSAPFALCQNETLIQRAPGGAFEIGGRSLPLYVGGRAQVGIRSGQVLDLLVDSANAKLVVADRANETRVLAGRGDASALMIRATPPGAHGGKRYSVDWLGRGGAIAHIADLPRLQGFKIASPDCAGLLAQADAAPAGRALDLSRRFPVAIDPPPQLPVAPASVDFTRADAATWEGGLGWLPPASWGSYAIGDAATLDFRLPPGFCHGARVAMKVDPYLPPSRAHLDTAVRVNGTLVETWRFAAPRAAAGSRPTGSDDHTVMTATFPVETGGRCKAHVRFDFERPGATAAPYPESEDPRPLQLRVLDLRLLPGSGSKDPDGSPPQSASAGRNPA